MKINFINLLLIVIIIFYLPISAQIDFEENLVFNSSLSTTSSATVVSIDIDGDGYNDIIHSKLYGKILWQKNNPTLNTFGFVQELIDIGVEHLYLADIDSDGDDDIISFDLDKIFWFKNNGNADFDEMAIITENVDRTESLFFADINNDTFIDVLSTSRNDNKLAWYPNDGVGNFNTQIVISTDLVEPKDVNVSDIDNDGDLDIISADFAYPFTGFQPAVVWFENLDGIGNFASPQIVANNLEKVKSILTTDINNDGNLDVIIGLQIGQYNGKLYSAINDGNGNFTLNLITDDLDRVIHLRIADLDLDGDMDIAFASTHSYRVSWFENLDGINFSNENVFQYSSTDVRDFTIKDLNNDGTLEIITASANNGISWYKNNGNGNFGNRTNIFSYSNYAMSNISSADMDGDGDKDIVSSTIRPNSDNDFIFWYENNGSGDFSNYIQHVVTSSAYGRIDSLKIDDLDGDGDNDIVTVSYEDYKIQFYRNNNGNISGPILIASNIYALRSVHTDDVDNDGDIDLIVTSYTNGGSTNKISWYENNGNASFVEHEILNPSYETLVNMADIDNDGDLDIISTSFFEGDINWFENLGNGNFGNLNQISSMSYCNSLNAKDIDGDGDIDIVASSGNNYNLVWYENIDGQGNFASHIVLEWNETKVSSSNLYDVDLDGDIDIICVLSDNNELVWFENTDGQGTFADKQIIASGISYNTFITDRITDINGDNVLDILTGDYNGEIFWYDNKGLISNEINGILSYDTNQNGCTTNDLRVPNVMVTSNDGTETVSTFTLENGFYQLFPNLGDYDLTISSNLSDYYSINPESYNFNFNETGNLVDANFCLEPTLDVNDLTTTLYPINTARPGFISSYILIFQNVGPTILSGNVVLEYDNEKLNFEVSDETIDSQTNNSITFSFNNLQPFQSKTINLQFSLFEPPLVNINDELNFIATINPVNGDETPSDNTFNLTQIVIGSFDPNNISCLEGDHIQFNEVDNYLHYLIRFQNTGNTHAVKVKVHNILDNKLDWETLKIESSSHNNRVEIKNGNEIDFIFNAIYLPDSTTDEPNSHGFIAYKIKPKTDIALGDIIPNKADIFFDFNAPIETNTATTTIVNVLAVNENKLLDFSVYPTPTENVLNIKSKTEISKIEIYSKLGQLILINETENNINISNLTNGLYFVKVEDTNGNFGVKKIMKK